MMQQLVDAITRNIERTGELYDQILAIERGKQRAIVASDIHALTQIVAREEDLVNAAAELEAERNLLRTRFAEADPRLGPDSRLEHIIAIIDGPPRDRLAERREHLLALAAQINEVNRLNFQLLRSSLDLVRGILHDVLGGSPIPSTYTPPGQHESPDFHAATRVDHVL